MKINLTFESDRLSAVATIETGTENCVSFILGSSLRIEKAECGGQTAEWSESEDFKTMPYCPNARKITIRSAFAAGSLTVFYSGTISGWMNVISPELKALSLYSSWYPRELSCRQTGDEVELTGLADHFLLKGVYDAETGLWRYGNDGFDSCNILAIRRDRLNLAKSDGLNIYCCDDALEPFIENIRSFHRDVLDFYTGKLFGFEKHREETDHVFLYPFCRDHSSYKRKGLIVSGGIEFLTLPHPELRIAYMEAHELAHDWCCGADCNTWEDWLNETTAEWSSLLYALERGNRELFDFILNPKLKEAPGMPAIRTPDGKRPEGVHTTGTVLFYDIYNRFGRKTVYGLIRAFVGLKQKTTAKFIEAVRMEVSPEAADIVEAAVEKA